MQDEFMPEESMLDDEVEGADKEAEEESDDTEEEGEDEEAA